MLVETLVEQFQDSGIRRVEVTGGEPLFQNECHKLLTNLCETGATVLLETGGAISVADVDSRVHIILDVKCPDSGMSHKMHQANIALLSDRSHELKFVVSSKSDFDWAVCYVQQKNLVGRDLLLSPVPGKVRPSDAAVWILNCEVDFRLQLQLHKLIWPDEGENR